MKAFWNNHPEVVKVLLEKGANVNTKTEFGKTVLDVAEAYEKIEMINLLKASGIIQ